ncbi:MAG: hemolysin family protein [bacterium]
MDLIILILQIGLMAFLLYLSSVFSGSETALFSLKTYQVRRLRAKPSRRSIKVESLLADPHHLLVTILVGNTLVNVAASSIGTNLVGKVFQENVVGISVVVMTVLILIFGEVVPKTFAVSNPLRVSLSTVPVISAVVRLLEPLRRVTEAAVSFADRLKPERPSSYEPDSPGDVVEALAMGHAEGVIDQFEGEVLGRIFRIENLSVLNIMTPRTEVLMLSSEVTLGEALGTIKSSGFSRVPIFDAEERDSIRGVLYTKDLLHKQGSPQLRVSEIARRPVFVPESKQVVDLLREFVTGKAHFAVAIDEHGSFAGIVTLDDILSEIIDRVGDRLPRKHAYAKVSRSKWKIPGRMETEFFNALVGVSIADSQAETVAGFIINRLGRIPAAGEELRWRGLRFKVLEADARRVKSIEVEKLR